MANPSALLLAAAMMLEHVGEIAGAARLRRALELALTEKTMRTPDLGGKASTEQLADAVIARL
jgi:isocitrate dehydrogenase (NAD+)